MKPFVESLVGIVLLLLLVALFPVFAVLSPVIVLLVIGYKVKSAISFRRFCRREAGTFYLICTTRKNWHDFIRNNISPILPDNVRVVWERDSSSYQKDSIFVQLKRSKLKQVAKPYLVFVRANKLLSKSLNAQLQAFRIHAAKSEIVQEECARIICEAMSEMQASA